MKPKALLIAALFLASSAAMADDINIDITSNPDKDFLLGYEHHYQGGCAVRWWESQWGTEHIMSIGGCPGVSQERVFKDMMSEMEYVKSTTKFGNFAEYFRDQEKKAAPPPPQTPMLCVDSPSGVYVFLPAEAQNKPGWFYISKLRNSGVANSGVVGFWQKNASGAIVADFGLSLININMANVKACDQLY